MIAAPRPPLVTATIGRRDPRAELVSRPSPQPQASFVYHFIKVRQRVHRINSTGIPLVDPPPLLFVANLTICFCY